MENRNQKFFSCIPLLFFQRFDHGAALKIDRKILHLNFVFDRYGLGTVVHYILIISKPYTHMFLFHLIVSKV